MASVKNLLGERCVRLVVIARCGKTKNGNRRNNRLLVFRGKTQTMVQWADEIGMPYKCLKHRINRGWNVADALTTPVGGRAL